MKKKDNNHVLGCPHQLRLFIIAVVLTGAGTLQAQQAFVFDNCSDLQSVVFVRGAEVRIACDTVYVLNQLTFRRYDSAYRDLRTGSPAAQSLMAAYDEIITLQEDRLRTQQEGYEQLRKQFADLSVESQVTLDETTRRLAAAATTMETMSGDLKQTRALLGEARTIIESEKRVLNLEKILWGAGGLVAGVVVGVLISK